MYVSVCVLFFWECVGSFVKEFVYMSLDVCVRDLVTVSDCVCLSGGVTVCVSLV